MEINSISQGRQIVDEKVYNTSSENVTSQNGTNDKDNLNESKEVNFKDVKKAVDKINKLLEGEQTHAEYSYHDFYKNDILIKIVDDTTGKVIQEIPPKKIIDMIAKMCEMVGVLVDKKA